MMQSTGTTNFVRKDLVSRNGIYYLTDDVVRRPELGMIDVLVKHKLRTIVSSNYEADHLWAKLQTYDPVTHEPIPRQFDHISSTSSTVSTSSVEKFQQPIFNSPQPTTSHIPTMITPQQTTSNTPTTSSAFSIPSIANTHLSPAQPSTPVQSSSSSTSSTSTPHIAKSFRSPPPSDYFVNNAATLSYLSISQFFKLPLHEACVALRVDESSLKKRCRELGIRRWPYRKRCNISSGKGSAQTQQSEDGGSGEQLFSCFQLNKGKGSPVVQKMKSEEALALEALDKLHNVNNSKPTTASSSTTTTSTPTQSTTTTTATTAPSVDQSRTTATPTTATTTAHVVQQQRPPVPQPPTGAYSYPPHGYPPHPGYPHMYPPHPGYHYPYGVPPPNHDGSQPVVPYPMYYPPQTAVPPPGAYPPTTETKDGQPQPPPPYVQPYYYDYRGYPYPPQTGSVPPYPYPQPGYSYPPHPEQATPYPYPPHAYPMPYPPHQMGYPVPPKPQTTPVIVSTSPAESQPVSGTPCRTVSGSSSDQTPTTPVGSPQTKMVYQRETKVLHPVRYKPPSPTETTSEIAAKIKRERMEEQQEDAKKVRRDIQIANPLCSKPVSSQTVQNGPLSTSIKVVDK